MFKFIKSMFGFGKIKAVKASLFTKWWRKDGPSGGYFVFIHCSLDNEFRDWLQEWRRKAGRDDTRKRVVLIDPYGVDIPVDVPTEQVQQFMEALRTWSGKEPQAEVAVTLPMMQQPKSANG